MEQGHSFTGIMKEYKLEKFSEVTHDKYIADLILKSKLESPIRRVSSLELLPEVWETVACECVGDLQRKFFDEAFIFRRSLLIENLPNNKLESLTFLSADALFSQRNSVVMLSINAGVAECK